MKSTCTVALLEEEGRAILPSCLSSPLPCTAIPPNGSCYSGNVLQGVRRNTERLCLMHEVLGYTSLFFAQEWSCSTWERRYFVYEQ